VKGGVKRKTIESILTFNLGVISYSVIENCVTLYLVWYSGVRLRFPKFPPIT